MCKIMSKEPKSPSRRLQSFCILSNGCWLQGSCHSLCKILHPVSKIWKPREVFLMDSTPVCTAERWEDRERERERERKKCQVQRGWTSCNLSDAHTFWHGHWCITCSHTALAKRYSIWTMTWWVYHHHNKKQERKSPPWPIKHELEHVNIQMLFTSVFISYIYATYNVNRCSHFWQCAFAMFMFCTWACMYWCVLLFNVQSL